MLVVGHEGEELSQRVQVSRGGGGWARQEPLVTTPRVPKQAKAKLAQNTLDRLRKDKDRRLPENQAVAKEKEGEGAEGEGEAEGEAEE